MCLFPAPFYPPCHTPYVITTSSAMYKSEGKETVNLEMTADIILVHPPTYRQVCNIHNH